MSLNLPSDNISWVDWDFIVIHHSLTKDTESVSWEAIRKYHKNKGWMDIGYHYGIELVADKFKIMQGRPITDFGAHCYQESMNKKGIGICFVGNYDIEEPKVQMLNVASSLLSSLVNMFDISVSHIVPHNKYATYKTCPGSLFPMNLLRDKVKELL